MRKVVGVTILVAAAAATWGAWGDVVASFPAPGSQAGGLTFDGTYLWFADYGSSSSVIYKMTTTGGFEGQYNVGWGYAMGLAWDGTYLWCDSLNSRLVYKLNPASCAVLESFTGPSAHMMGMGCDGTYLYTNDWSDVRISKVTFTGSLRQLIPISGPSPGGAAVGAGYLWYTTRDYWTPTNALCYKALLSNGSTVASFQCPDSQSPDLAFDGTYLWVSGFTTKYIYKVDVGAAPAVAPTSLGKVKTLFR